jgi:hypothetical protein
MSPGHQPKRRVISLSPGGPDNAGQGDSTVDQLSGGEILGQHGRRLGQLTVGQGVSFGGFEEMTGNRFANDLNTLTSPEIQRIPGDASKKADVSFLKAKTLAVLIAVNQGPPDPDGTRKRTGSIPGNIADGRERERSVRQGGTREPHQNGYGEMGTHGVDQS